MLSIETKIPLNNGTRLPALGFGAYKVDDQKTGEAALSSALELGYRLIDTASIYQNEELVGKVLTQSNLNRHEVFITTKLWLDEQGAKETPEALEISLEKLQTDYVDLYLMHWPHPDPSRMQPCWEAMQALSTSGKCRAIGVSNFTERRLLELFALSDCRPAVNQVECNVFNNRSKLAAFCHSHGLLLQAYSPLARSHGFDHRTLRQFASKYQKSVAQVMLRWCLQHGIPVIPKSATPRRIKENADLFDFLLSKVDMDQLDLLNEDFEVSDWKPDPENWY